MILIKQSILQNILPAKFSIFNFIFLFFFLFTTNSYSVEKILVTGNKNISTNTILSLAQDSLNSQNIDSLNEYQKKIFNTGYFEKVNISVDDKKIIIEVIENPLINFFLIEGFKQKDLLDQLYKNSKIKENNIFQPYLIKNDLIAFQKSLSGIGYLNNKISYKINKIENNKVNIFYSINLNEKFRINKIFFIGDKYFKSSILHDVIYSSEYGWWKFLSNSTIPSETAFNYDISRLKKFYLDNGFYDVQIVSNSIKIFKDNKADLVFSINSGPKYIVKSTVFQDLSNSLSDKDLKYFKSKLDKINNSFYSKTKIESLQNLFNRYLLNGNYNLFSNFDLKKIELNKFSLIFNIEQIQNNKIIEKISVIGNNITDDSVVRNNIQFSEGDIFNNEILKSSITFLKGKGLFSKVDSEVIEIDDNKINILVKVEETATGEISAGAGGGTNGVGFTAGINEKNFLGKGIKLNSNLNFGTQKILGSISYYDPDFNSSGRGLNNYLAIENNDFDNAGYKNKLITLSTSLDYEFLDKVFLNPGVSIDYDKVDANSDASNIIKKREGDFFTSKLFYNLSKNTKNSDFQTTEGYIVGVGQGISLISDIQYIKNSFFGSFFNEYKENFIGSIKYRIETINSFNDDIKFSDRLFVSSKNLRGFSNRGIGPKIDNDFIGGNYSYYGSISSTIPNGLPDKWNAKTNVFFDTANVWGVDDKSTDNSNKIRSSLGLGFSWISPLGPISLTYAEPITKSSTDDVEQFNFSIGSAF